jgi:hypothetical protein
MLLLNPDHTCLFVGNCIVVSSRTSGHFRRYGKIVDIRPPKIGEMPYLVQFDDNTILPFEKWELRKVTD